jgi:YjjG family noncanonical pyrimidine nucleotidase
MKFTPKAIFFDWDHTLWDHDRNAREVLTELFVEFRLPALDSDLVWNTFQQINDSLWEAYQLGQISQETLRETRFVRFFSALQMDGPAAEFSNAYLFRTPRKTNMLPGAFEVIEILAEKYPLYILTNGFNDIQWVKIEGAGMRHFFQEIITSEVAGHKKPARGFFEYALNAAGITPAEALMVGDHPVIDIRGAAEAGIEGIHLNLRSEAQTCEHQILDLRELLHLIV